MKLNIYLFRHGETHYNKNRVFTGWKDSKLTEHGIRDARKVAGKLKGKKFQVAFQTRLSRSKDTLREVIKYHPECKEVITDDRMIERSYGKLEGRTHKRIIGEFGKRQYDEWHRSYSVAPPGGESIKDVEKRANAFISDLLKKMKREKISSAISAHGNSMRPFRKRFEGLTNSEMMALENPWDDYFEYTVDA